MTDIEELTKLMFEFEAEMDKHQALMEEHWQKSNEYEKLMRQAKEAHNESRVDYKEAFRQLQLIREQLKKAVKDK
jgi:hypothetical protein